MPSRNEASLWNAARFLSTVTPAPLVWTFRADGPGCCIVSAYAPPHRATLSRIAMSSAPRMAPMRVSPELRTVLWWISTPRA